MHCLTIFSEPMGCAKKKNTLFFQIASTMLSNAIHPNNHSACVGLSFGERLTMTHPSLWLFDALPADPCRYVPCPKTQGPYMLDCFSPQLLLVVLLYVKAASNHQRSRAAHTNCAAPAPECPQALIEIVCLSGWSLHQGCCGALIRNARQSSHDSSCSF